ncbi:MAG: Gfo/Idh/MocA family oxidoreductase, partial [Candidatus Eremiobacteraeota bacterium]|nr:Gfo/Idh/MocA family oxidoreductase [Candidatus Eremiobacteraeota bacterium]
MQVGMVGLGKMGANMVQRLLQGKHEVSAYDRDPEAVKKSAADGATGCDSLESLVRSLKHPRAVWIMVPSGDPTHETIAQLQTLLQEGDVVIDGGNSYWKDGQEQERKLGSAGVSVIDAGVSGG